MTEFSRGSFGERAVMVCQICGSPHHDQPRQVLVQGRRGLEQKICPMCICLDCVQTQNDPIRTQLRPKIMGQTFKQHYNLEVEEFKPGTPGPVKKNISFDAPGPFNAADAIKQMSELLGLGLQGQSPQPHRIPQAVGCGCGKNATSRCISCEVPLCMKCLKAHECK